MRAAASSIASGRPSSRRQISATAAALPSVRAKSGRTARARSTNSATAGEAASSASGSAGGVGGQRQRRHRVLPLGPQPQHRPAGRQDRHAPGSGPAARRGRGRRSTTCSRLSRISSHAVVAERARPGPPAASPSRARSAPTARPTPASTSSGSVTAASGTNAVPRTEAVTQPLAHRHRQPGLADPARPGQRHQPHVRALDQPGHLVDGLLPPDQRRRAHRQRARPARAAAAPRPRPAARGGEPLAQQHRQVVAHQPAQLSRRAEVTVGHRALRPDPGQQLGQARLAVGRRRLDVQQPRQRRATARTRPPGPRPAMPGTDPAVPLPVQPDEHVALRQVGPVQLLRRVRPGPQLEHHRRQPQRRDGTRDRPPLVGQLAQRGTHEHPQALVRRPDGHVTLRGRAHLPLDDPRAQPTELGRPPRSESPSPGQRMLVPPMMLATSIMMEHPARSGT